MAVGVRLTDVNDGASRAVTPGLINLTERELQQVSDHCYDQICAQIQEYRECAPDVANDVRRNVTAGVRLHYDVSCRSRMPSAQEMVDWMDGIRRRVHHGFSIESILRSCRLGIHITWQEIGAYANSKPDSVRAVSELAFRYIDHISNAAENVYRSERETILHSRQQSMQLLLHKLIDQRPSPDAEIELIASTVNYSIEGPHVAVVVAIDDRAEIPLGVSRSVGAEFYRALPDGVIAFRNSNIVIVLHTNSPANASRMVRSVLGRVKFDLPHKVGISSPGAGIAGLRGIVSEAERALLIGRIWDPVDRCYSYQDVVHYDIFKQGQELTGFINKVVEPFAEVDRAKDTALLSTLAAYYSEGMNRKMAAHRLGIHPNTLDYRLRQAEKIAGASISSGDCSFRFQLAIRLMGMTSQTFS